MDTATCWFGTFVFVLKPAQSIGSTTPTEVTCSFFLCFRQVLFSVSVRWNLSRGSSLHIIHMMVRRERHYIDYRNCQKMLLLYTSFQVLSLQNTEQRPLPLSELWAGAMRQLLQVEALGFLSWWQHVPTGGRSCFFFCLLTFFFLHGCTLSDLSNAAAMFLFGYRLSVVISFLLQSLPLRAPRLWLEKCCCWPWTRKVLHPLI